MQDKSKEGSMQAPSILENLLATEVYADEAAFFSTKGGNVSITFTSVRFDNASQPATVRNVVIGRLVMPAQGAQALAIGLFDYLKQHGLDPRPQGKPAN